MRRPIDLVAAGEQRQEQPGMNRVRVPRVLLDRTLNCYLPSVRYLVGAEIEYADDGLPFATEVGDMVAIARGRFTTRTDWYIDDTGHFNAVEFNLCYNQLAYTLLAQSVASGIIPALSEQIPAIEFRERQLTDLLIRRYMVTFDHPMKADHFVGVVAIRRVIGRMGRLFLETHARMGPVDGPWCSTGEITLAVVGPEI